MQTAAQAFTSKNTVPVPPSPEGHHYTGIDVFWGEVAVVSKTEKQSLRYSDYYWCMSLKDFIEWVEADDDNEPGTSYSDRF